MYHWGVQAGVWDCPDGWLASFWYMKPSQSRGHARCFVPHRPLGDRSIGVDDDEGVE